MQPKKQLKVQYIGIFQEIDSFYWPKMHFLKKGQKNRAWVDTPSLIQAMPERKRFFSVDVFPKFSHFPTMSHFSLNISMFSTFRLIWSGRLLKNRAIQRYGHCFICRWVVRLPSPNSTRYPFWFNAQMQNQNFDVYYMFAR